MAHEDTSSLDKTLESVDNTRRGFLKALLIGTASIAAVPLLKTTALAGEKNDPADEGKGKGKGGGRPPQG